MKAHDRLRAGVLIVSIISVMSFVVHSSLLSAKTKHDADRAATAAPPSVQAPVGPLVTDAPSSTASAQLIQIGDPFRPVLPDPDAAVTTGTPSVGGTGGMQGAWDKALPHATGQGYNPITATVEAPRLGLKLEGVVVKGKALAVLSWGDSHFYASAGDTVGDGFVVVAVDRDGAILKKGIHRYSVQIGDSLDQFVSSPVSHR